MSGRVLDKLVLVGAESSGKSSLFRGLTGWATGDEANFRGSTVVCRRCRLPDGDCEIVDTPGIREGGAEAARLALAEVGGADAVLLVARGTDLSDELAKLLRELPLLGKRTAVAVTFADKAPEEIEELVKRYRVVLDVPVVALNARDMKPENRAELIAAIRDAKFGKGDVNLPAAPVVCPPASIFERPVVGPMVSLFAVLAMYGVPVWMAYDFSGGLQPHVDALVISPVKEMLTGLPTWAAAMVVGNYGLLTLGWYSFLWAFPVVVLIGLSSGLAEESGLHDRISRALDPWLRKIGLDGRDLLPVLSGFGCNVVAVMQSRACSSCTRKACVSMISFGSACSYQIGATLAVFGAAGRPGLFFPYLVMLFIAGAMHTRWWHGRRQPVPPPKPGDRAFFQRPRWRAVAWRVRSVTKQFLLQAMPVFLGICLLAAVLETVGVLAWLARAATPIMALFYLPGEAAAGWILSILRKDGILVLIQGDSAMLAGLSALPLLLLVWVASTFSACLVTLWTVGRELGWRSSAALAGKQAATCLSVALILSVVSHLFS
jgi:ferrous iron transport protein B